MANPGPQKSITQHAAETYEAHFTLEQKDKFNPILKAENKEPLLAMLSQEEQLQFSEYEACVTWVRQIFATYLVAGPNITIDKAPAHLLTFRAPHDVTPLKANTPQEESSSSSANPSITTYRKRSFTI